MVTSMFALRRAPRGTTLPPMTAQVELSAVFEQGLVAVEQRWPEAPVGEDAFAAYVRAHLDRERDLSRRLHVEDLFLAWWAMTCPAGIDAFVAELGDTLAPILACFTTRFAHLEADSLMDLLLTRLFFGDDARIAEFSGFGSLRAWVEVVATQTFLEASRSPDLHYRRERFTTEMRASGVAAS